jgi:hypothetical protein
VFEDRDDTRADRALHAGLRDLPVPEAASDFDARILAALAPRPPWWQTVWLAMRPAIPMAAGALAVMLLLVYRVQQAPVGIPSSSSGDIARAVDRENAQVEARRDAPHRERPSLESMDNLDLNPASLGLFSHPLGYLPGKRG